MKRILIFTGKGGVGKTSVAAAHALKSAREGKKTIIVSTDMAHNLSDLFELKIGKEEKKIEENLYALEIDPNYALQKDYKHMMDSFVAMISSTMKGKVDIDEFTMIPGMDELFSLLKILDLYNTSDYERIIVDCAPTGETLSLLKFPELLCWYMDKFFPIGKVAVRVLSPVSKALFKMELPDKHAMNDIQKFYAKLIELQELLKNKEVTSVRLVTLPEKMVIEETKRNYMYMNLYNYNVDGIFINRILPKELDNKFFNDWIAIQQKYIDEVDACFSHISKYNIPWFDTDLVGIDSVAKISEGVLKDTNDLFAVKVGEQGESYEKNDKGYVMKLFLPNITKDEVTINMSGSDVIIKIGNYKRNIPIPNVLRGMDVVKASFVEEHLEIQFEG